MRWEQCCVTRYPASSSGTWGPRSPGARCRSNFIGCFLIGLLWGLFDAAVASPNLRSGVLVGVLGAFTTFSRYGLECLTLLRSGELRLWLANVLASNALGLLLVVCGLAASGYMLSALK